MSDVERVEIPARVGYILKQYPRLSETFILNEILGLEQRGVEVSVFSLRHATEGRFHPALASVKAQVHYLANVDKTAFLDALRALPGLRSGSLPAVLDFVDRLPADRRPRLVLQAIEIANAVQSAEIEHLHAHFLTVASHTAHLVHLLTGLPYTVTAHAKDVYRHTVDWDLAIRIAEGAESVITVCDANLRYLRHRFDGADTRLVRIYNGLGPQDPPAAATTRHEGLILGVGRLVEKKGFDLVLDALAELRSTHPQVHCVLVGDGDQRTALESQAARLGIAERVTFTGSLPQDDVARWLRKAQLLAAPCRIGHDGNQDALPTVLLEALGAGLPAVTTAVAGIPEIVTHGVEGVIVDTDDVGSLVRGIAGLLDDPKRREAMAHAGPMKLRRQFDRSTSIEHLIASFRTHQLVA